MRPEAANRTRNRFEITLAMEQLRQLTPQALEAYRASEAASVKLPYAVIAVALLLLAIVIGVSKLPKIETARNRAKENGQDSVWKHPNLLFGALGIFAYVGAEVSIGSFLVNYFGLPGHRGNVREDRRRVRLVLLGVEQ